MSRTPRWHAWGPTAVAVALGFGAFYHHAADPNADFLRRHDDLVIEYEEITIRHGCPIWFEPVDAGEI